MKEIKCPNCNQRIKIIDTIGYDLYKENLIKEEQEIERLNKIIEYLVDNSDEATNVYEDYLIKEKRKQQR